MKFWMIFTLFLSAQSFGKETPVGSIGNAKNLTTALLNAGAELDSNHSILVSQLHCNLKASPDLTANCTFNSTGATGKTVKGNASEADSWLIAFTLIGAGALKEAQGDEDSTVQVQKLTCSTLDSGKNSTCLFLE
jgi:hypothetical protein